jgi:uncharacterized protein YkwD
LIQHQRLGLPRALSRPGQVAFAAAGAIVLSLTSAQSPPQPAAITAARTAELKGAQSCANIDLVYQQRSAFPNTSRGGVDFILQRATIERAVICLINAERAALKPPAPPLKRWLNLGKGNKRGLSGAAAGHVKAAVELRWWGKVATVGKGNCVARKDDPTECNSHINPKTKTDPTERAVAAGYGRGCKTFYVSENTYTASGRAKITPRAAVGWWMNSDGHRATIRDPQFTDTTVQVAWGSANPADPDATPATPGLAYVQMFGSCT